MKNFSWYVVAPLLLLVYHLADTGFIFFGLNPENPSTVLIGEVMKLSSLFLYMILNALIAYIVYRFNENKGLMWVHIIYVGLILMMLNSSQDPAAQALSQLMQILLDIFAVIYATRVVHAQLKFWFKLFTISVLAETLIALFGPIILDATIMEITNSLIALLVTGILIVFFWKLNSFDSGTPEKKEPGDLLSSDDYR